MGLPRKRDTRLVCPVEQAVAFAKARELEYGLLELYDHFLVDNPGVENPEAAWKRMTTGQRHLARIAVFDMEIKNGGVEQYFWNHPNTIFDIYDSLVAVGAVETAGEYSALLDRFTEVGESWLDLRARFTGGTSEDLELFIESREVLDTDDFDDAYSGEWDGAGTKVSPGLGDTLCAAMVEYLEAKPGEFVRE